MIGDIVAVLLGFGIAGFVYHGSFTGKQPMMQMLMPIFPSIAFYNGAYSFRALERGIFPSSVPSRSFGAGLASATGAGP